MRLFISNEEKQLDALLEAMRINMENNYKDLAQKDFKKFSETYFQYKENGKLKSSAIKHYENQLAIYSEKLKDYSHKDQKPYWTNK